MKQSIALRLVALLVLAAPSIGAAQASGRRDAVPDGLTAADWSALRQAVEASRRADRGSRQPLTIDPTAQQAYLKPQNTGRGDNFGVSVSVSGDTVVVGASAEDSESTGVDGEGSNNNAQDSGAAYVFVRSGASWSRQAYLKASNTDAGDWFGQSVSVSGDTVVVGAPREDGDATGVNGNQAGNGKADAGAAYVFVRNGTTWSQEAYLKASNADANDRFGSSVSVSGDTVVVGARWEQSAATGVNGDEADNAADDAGAAYVFVRNGTAWSQEAYLKASNTDAYDEFGGSVSVSADTVVVGAERESSAATGVNGNGDDDSAPGAGAAYVFVRNGTAWSQEAYLKASNTDANDRFGWSVSVSGDVVVAGAPHEDSNATGVNGDQGDDSAQSAGAAYVFARNGTTWSQAAYLKASNTDEMDVFGWSVSSSGGTVVVGALLEDSEATGVNGSQGNSPTVFFDSGAAYAFVRDGTVWSQRSYLKASNTDEKDDFGVSVSASGGTVVVGANREDSIGLGVNGSQGNVGGKFDAGAAYAFAPLASATFRNAGPNPASYAAPPPVLGTNWTVTVDLTTTGHDLARVRGFAAPTTRVLAGGQVLLVAGTPLGGLPSQSGPLASWSVLVPDDPALAGFAFHTQAIHFGGVTPFALSNARDLVVGY